MEMILSFILIATTLMMGGESWALENCSQEQARLRAQVQQLEIRVKQQQVTIAQLLHEREVQFLDKGEENSVIDLGSKRQYADCSEIFNDGYKRSGFYKIKPLQSPAEFPVYCDMSDGGGWTVIQRRSDGSENFNRGWNDYENGFGNFVQRNGEYWLGNKNLHLLTTQESSTWGRVYGTPHPPSLLDLLQKWESRISSPSNLELVSRPFLVFFFACPPAADVYTPEPEGKLSNSFYLGHGQRDYTLKINLEDFEKNSCYAQYKTFKVGDEKNSYDLHIGDYSGTAGDSLSGTFHPEVQWWASHQRMKFSTWDRDNDNYKGNCAEEDQSGWWFNRCHSANLNGVYYSGPYTAETDNGVVWYTWRGWWYSLKSVVMKIRPNDFIPNII